MDITALLPALARLKRRAIGLPAARAWFAALLVAWGAALMSPSSTSADEQHTEYPDSLASQDGAAEPMASSGHRNPPRLGAASRRQPRASDFDQPDDEPMDESFPRTPFFGMPHVVVNDPAAYPRPPVLDNYNPDSFFYSLRPNIFNVPVEPEWDFYNIINTDRPDFTDAVYSVGKGVALLETGYTFHKQNTAETHFSTRQLPESLLRYGVTDEFELRLKWPGYLMVDSKTVATGVHAANFGSQDIDLGFKYELIQQRGWRPMTTLVAGMTLPTGSRGLSANYVQPHFNLVAGWGFRRWLYLKWQTGADFLRSSATGVSTVGSVVPAFVTVGGAQNSWHESISLLTQWTKRVGAYHEWFMISGTGSGDRSAAHYLDMGLYLYATPNVQFDVRVGRRISNRVNDYFTGAGFSGRW
ncbi:MAG TPA: transporter [Pirellulales bacterium]|nr:transporter [Pirellulales bacterium]